MRFHFRQLYILYFVSCSLEREVLVSKKKLRMHRFMSSLLLMLIFKKNINSNIQSTVLVPYKLMCCSYSVFVNDCSYEKVVTINIYDECRRRNNGKGVGTYVTYGICRDS